MDTDPVFANKKRNEEGPATVFNFPPLFPSSQGPILSPIPAFSAMATSQPFESTFMIDSTHASDSSGAREALKFRFAPEGAFFREFIMDELVRSIDALSRDQLKQLVTNLGLSGLRLPLLLPGSRVLSFSLAPNVSEEDKLVVENVTKLLLFLLGGEVRSFQSFDGKFAQDLLPVLPNVVNEVMPELSRRLFSRISARLIRELYIS
eukprot:TRINITY_DN9489_c0_g2_i1.p1 TRINITY_DN9489_c0_g2~~TRINITY_DN9489_c0_g2_i1.p1  ORF type:complete len:206 (-),score=22.77 TRINITY_DN9489_c0_g2_i1:252-869(-)